MDLSPYNHRRSDNKLNRYGSTCNLIALLLTLVMITGFAQAEIKLDKLIFDFKPGKAHHDDLRVLNKHEKNNLYVNVEIREVIHPGTDKEQRVLLEGIKNLPLVITPNKMVVPPGGKKNVRVVVLADAGKVDRIFRADFTPAEGPLKAKASGIKLILAYQILVIVRPEKPVGTVTSERKGDQVLFRNTGNTNVYLKSGRQCNPKDKKDCRELDPRRLYAGNEWLMKPPFPGAFTYDLDDGNQVVTRTFGDQPGAAEKKQSGR